MNSIFPLRASHLLAVAVTTSALVACGGGGGGGKASGTSRAINSQNQTQIVAAVMGQLASTDSLEQIAGGDDSSAALMTRARLAVTKARAARAAVEIPGYCRSGRVLFDADTGEQTYQDCVLGILDGVSMRLDGTISAQDFSEDPDALYDFVNGYAIQVSNAFANGDTITASLNGSSFGNMTETGSEHAETRMVFTTNYVCHEQTGNFTGDYDIISDVTVTGDESTYVENGQMRFVGGTWIFQGDLDIETTEALRYRDGYNDDYPYDGSYKITASDGSSVALSFAVGGIYVGDQFYTWAQFQDEVVIDDVYADCGNASI